MMRTIHGLPFQFGGQVAKLFDLATENPMAENPVQSERQKMDAKAWEEFGSCLSDLSYYAQRLPISPEQRRILLATLRYTLEITEFIEGR